jgi:TolB protein
MRLNPLSCGIRNVVRAFTFAPKLTASLLAAAGGTLAVVSSVDLWHGGGPSEPGEVSSSQFHKQGAAARLPASFVSGATEEDGAAAYPRAVKTVRFFDPQIRQERTRSRRSFAANAWLEDMKVPDGSLRLRIPLPGSLQNPAWSPDGSSIVFTRFRKGYNKGPADLYVFDLTRNVLTPLVADGTDNVSQPGSTWNARTGQIVFSSDRDGHEELFVISSQGGQDTARKITSRSSLMALEPSFSPEGGRLVFETRVPGEGARGRITMLDLGEMRYQDLTSAQEDCRQPNWSPRGDYILYQKRSGSRWSIWLYDLANKTHRLATPAGDGDKTDATFSPDARYIVYSGEYGDEDGEYLLAAPLTGGKPFRITRHSGYHGAASWSPDGSYLVQEASEHSSGRDPARTQLILTPVQLKTAMP